MLSSLAVEDYENGVVSKMVSNLPQDFPNSSGCENGILIYDSLNINREVNQLKQYRVTSKRKLSHDDISPSITLDEVVRALGMEGPGCVIVRNVFSKEDMLGWNQWIQTEFQRQSGTSKRKDHFSSENLRIWHVPEKMLNCKSDDQSIPKPKETPKEERCQPLEGPASSDTMPNPNTAYSTPQRLLVDFLTHPVLSAVVDGFLGRYHIGSLAINEVIPGGSAQNTHSDYPPGFYSKQDMLETFSSYHLEKVMPYFSLQAGIAVTDFCRENGATEMVPFSHRIKQSDFNVLPNETSPSMKPIDASSPKALSEVLEPHITTVSSTLPAGSVIFFNRKLLHRGGKNETDQGRTAILLQAIMPFGVKMETVDHVLCMKGYDKWLDADTSNKANIVATSATATVPSNETDSGSSGGGSGGGELSTLLNKALTPEQERERRSLVQYRLQGPTFPRDLDQSKADDDNN